MATGAMFSATWSGSMRRRDVVAQVVDVRGLVVGYLPEQPVEAHLDGLPATLDEPVVVEQHGRPCPGLILGH